MNWTYTVIGHEINNTGNDKLQLPWQLYPSRNFATFASWTVFYHTVSSLPNYRCGIYCTFYHLGMIVEVDGSAWLDIPNGPSFQLNLIKDSTSLYTSKYHLAVLSFNDCIPYFQYCYAHAIQSSSYHYPDTLISTTRSITITITITITMTSPT